MKRIVIVVLSELSSGELTIGYEFGSRLDRTKYEVTFLIHEKFASYLEDKKEAYVILNVNVGALHNKQTVVQFIHDYQPNYLLISDVFTTEYSRLWSGITIQLLKSFQIPILGIDEYQYLSTKYTPDYYGGVFEALPHLLNECDFIIRNCPLNCERQNKEENIKCFSLYDKHLNLSEEDKRKVRNELGIKENQKLVFYASSSWEEINFHKTPSLGKLIKWLPSILENYFMDIGEDIKLLHVGPKSWEMRMDMEGKFEYQNFSYCKPSDFDRYLLASDLFITTNVVSVTLSKAIYGNVPSIVFQNYKCIEFANLINTLKKRPHWYQIMAMDLKFVYPFRAGFFGWYRLLEKVLEENDYEQSYETVQLFKYNEVIEKLRTYLFCEDEIDDLKRRQTSYIDKILELPSPQQIMEEVDHTIERKLG